MLRNKKKTSRKTFFTYITILVLLLLSSIAYVTSRYKHLHFGDAKIDEIIFYFLNGFDGQSDSLLETAQDNLLFCSIVLFLLLLPVIDFYRNRIIINLDLSFLGRKKATVLNPSKISTKAKLIYAISVFIISVWMLLSSFSVFDYVASLARTGQLFEQHYVEPEKVNLTFPEKKRNLIYIYLESMENTVGSTKNGGQSDSSLIPELEALALDPNNLSFTHQESGLGGALPAYGTTWTVGAITAQSAGVPLKPNMLGEEHNGFGRFNEFLPGAYTLGQVLEREGYNQTFMIGSSASFGGRDKLFTQHGNYHIMDYDYAIEHGMIPPDYKVWWGYEDKKLFEHAQTELTRLSQLNSPFNFQLLTVDTHFTDGWLDPTCPTPHEKQYDNVHACSSSQVAKFVDWVSRQAFADNTTVIITGDHMGMQTSYYNELIQTPDYSRTLYNVFINSPIKPVNRTKRLYSSLDMYPTTLAAMGVVIDGERLGLGVNLFSDQSTLVEQYGSIDALNAELTKRSEYYERQILLRP